MMWGLTAAATNDNRDQVLGEAEQRRNSLCKNTEGNGTYDTGDMNKNTVSEKKEFNVNLMNQKI